MINSSKLRILILILLSILLGNLAGDRLFSKKNEVILKDNQQTSELVPISIKATLGEQKEFLDKLRLLAADTNSIKFSSNCKMTPQVVNLTAKDALQVQNSDSNKHIISLFPDIATLSAGEKTTIKIQFKKGGYYSINCDNKFSGYILLGAQL